MTVTTLWGAFCGPTKYPNADPIEDKATMRARVCSEYGVTTLGVERLFNMGGWAPPPAAPCIISFDQDPSAVAAGDFDAEIAAFVAALNPDIHYWLCLNHEPETKWTPGNQVAGFRRFHDVVMANRTSVKTKTAPILMAFTLIHGNAEQWYPGDDYCDALGFDSYWRPTTENTAAKAFQPCINYAVTKDKPLLICETSMGAVNHGGKMLDFASNTYVDIPEASWTTFVTEAKALLNGNARAVCWFETCKVDGSWRLYPHTDAAAAWKA
jgi:hypothetical protein